MTQEQRNQGALWGGLILIALGVFFLLDRLDMLRFPWIIARWWPSLLILFGVAQLLTSCRRRFIGPIVLIAIGVIMQGQMLDWFWWWRMGKLWPFILIAVGVGLLLKRMQGSSLPGAGGAPLSR